MEHERAPFLSFPHRPEPLRARALLPFSLSGGGGGASRLVIARSSIKIFFFQSIFFCIPSPHPSVLKYYYYYIHAQTFVQPQYLTVYNSLLFELELSLSVSLIGRTKKAKKQNEKSAGWVYYVYFYYGEDQASDAPKSNSARTHY